MGFPGGSVEEPTCKCRRHGFNTWVWEDALEKEMATHSSILAWRIPWMEEPGGLQSTGLQRVGQVMPLETVSYLRADFMTLSLRLVDSHLLSHLSDIWELWWYKFLSACNFGHFLRSAIS